MITQIHFFSRYLDGRSHREGRRGLDHRRVVLDGSSLSSFAPMPALQAAVGSEAATRTDLFYAHCATLAKAVH